MVASLKKLSVKLGKLRDEHDKISRTKHTEPFSTKADIAQNVGRALSKTPAARHRRLPWFRWSCGRKVLDTGKLRIRELILGWVPKCFEGGRWY